MNFKKIIAYNVLRGQLTAEELVLAGALYAASDTERELLVESLQPEKPSGKKKSSKKAGGGGKSSRASNMAATLNKNLAQQRKPICVACGNSPDHADHGTGEGQHEFSTEIGTRIVDQMKHHESKCAYELDGKVCHGLEDDSVHDKSLGYLNYHEFQSEQAAAAGSASGD